ncbi:MAG: TIGR00730 family Rossman fold protein [Luteitalea sp.]|nr:TIGR00730 family Rossman fold protein [Luteitalea sp.]
MRWVCVFCGSSRGRRSGHAASARQLARALVARELGLVYGGAHVGLMGELADAMLAAGGKVIGVIPQALVDREVAHTGLADLRVVDGIHARKARMAELGDAFVALPGGIGTLEELFEVWTWLHLGLHRKPCGLADVEGFYRPLVRFLDHAVAEGFVRPDARATLLVDANIERLLDRLVAAMPPRASAGAGVAVDQL